MGLMKVFTVLEALIQQNEGRLNIEDDIRKYIDDFRLFDDADSKISLRQLGSHLSGLGRDSTNPLMSKLILVLANDLRHFPRVDELNPLDEHTVKSPAYCDPGIPDRSNGTRLCTRDDVLRAIASRPLAFEPWTRPLYSNTGFDLLGWATAEAYKRNKSSKETESEDAMASITVEDLLRRDVFEPLDMQDTSFWVGPERRDRVAVPTVPSWVDTDLSSTFNPYFPGLQD
jgi:CubicO group peptidase (beta-lactamase class C family)